MVIAKNFDEDLFVWPDKAWHGTEHERLVYSSPGLCTLSRGSSAWLIEFGAQTIGYMSSDHTLHCCPIIVCFRPSCRASCCAILRWYMTHNTKVGGHFGPAILKSTDADDMMFIRIRTLVYTHRL